METITVNIENKKLVKKVTEFLEHLKNDGLEIVSREDISDLKLLKLSRADESIPLMSI